MSVRRRVLVVARHYWPSTNDQTLRLRAWTRNLRNDGYDPLVLSPRWNRAWPRSYTCEEIPVQLLDMPAGTQLLSRRYARTLVDRVQAEMSHAEAIYCDTADSDTLALLAHLPKHRRPPLIVRFDSPNLSGAASFTVTRKLQQMADVCRKSTAVVVSNAIAHQQLLAQGIDSSRIHRWPDDLILRVDRSTSSMSSARHVLSHTQHDLHVRGQDRLVVCPGELTDEWEIGVLVKALGPLVEQFRSLKLWVLGDGKGRSQIYDELKHQGWHRLVVMPGCFTDLEHVLQAADLCIFPSAEIGWQWLIPTCVANSIPFFVADGQIARHMLGAASEQLCFRPHDFVDLQTRTRSWYRQSLNAFQPALAEAREQIALNYSRSSNSSLSSMLSARLSQPS